MKIEIGVVSGVIKLDEMGVGRMRTFPFLPIPLTGLSEEPTNRKARNQTLSLVYSSASACDSDNAVFTLSQATESQAESVFCFRLRRFDFH